MYQVTKGHFAFCPAKDEADRCVNTGRPLTHTERMAFNAR